MGSTRRADHDPVDGRSLPGIHVWILACVSGLVSLLAAVISIRLTRQSLHLPWTGGDAPNMYQFANTMIRFGWFTWNPDVGYPYGMDMASYPNPELHQWSLLRLVTLFGHDPIVALNVFFLLGFFIVGAASYLLFRPTIRHDLIAVLLAVSCATVPWHVGRFQHTLLADYSPVPIGLLLAFLMWNKWWAHGRARLALALVAATYIGTGGAYYSFFACLALGPVLIWRIWATRSWRQWWRDVVVAAAIPATLALSLALHASLVRTPTVEAPFARNPVESLAYAGRLESLVVPWPWARGVSEGHAKFSLLGSGAVVVCVVLLVVLIFASRPSASGSMRALERELNPWLRMFVWMSLWFVPGMGYAFALLVSPSIRSWGRVSIVILYIATVVLGVCLRAWGGGGRSRMVVVAATLLVVVSWQVLQDQRAILPTWTKALDAQARAYAAAITEALPPHCPVLQIPVMTYPEGWASAMDDMGSNDRIGAYDHMWPQIYAPSLRWSFGVVKGTRAAQLSEERYSTASSAGQLIASATQDGFCAVHVDMNRVTPGEAQSWTDTLGAPEVEVGPWRLHVLPTG